MMQIKIILTDQATMTITRILRRGTTAAKTINKNVLKRQKANNSFVFNTNSYGNTKNTWSYFQSFQNSRCSNIKLQSKNLYLHEIEYMRNEKENRNSEGFYCWLHAGSYTTDWLCLYIFSYMGCYLCMVLCYSTWYI